MRVSWLLPLILTVYGLSAADESEVSLDQAGPQGIEKKFSDQWADLQSKGLVPSSKPRKSLEDGKENTRSLQLQDEAQLKGFMSNNPLSKLMRRIMSLFKKILGIREADPNSVEEVKGSLTKLWESLHREFCTVSNYLPNNCKDELWKYQVTTGNMKNRAAESGQPKFGIAKSAPRSYLTPKSQGMTDDE